MSDGPLSHINLLISTPVGDGSLHHEYVASLLKTRNDLLHFGAEMNWTTFPNCSDLCHVRNKILGSFLRMEEFTHLLLVDDDMGWESGDVIRMLTANKEFVAGVGCKKKIPREWCCSHRSDEDGVQGMPYFYEENGQLYAELNYVGAGFVLLSRSCAQKMMDHYKDLWYIDCYDKLKEVAVYDPVIIVNGDYRERYFDDFAFCYRWRQIGGKVTVIPDIHLKHSGNYTFEGKWQESFVYGEEEKN